MTINSGRLKDEPVDNEGYLLRLKYFRCSHGLLHPFGGGWCSLTMKPCTACSDNFERGRAKLWKQEPQIITPKQEARKIKIKETKVKPVIISNKSSNSSKKSKPNQSKLF